MLPRERVSQHEGTVGCAQRAPERRHHEPTGGAGAGEQSGMDGACHLALHGKAASQAERLGVCEIALSLSHDGDYAAAVVTALLAPVSDDSILS